MFAAVLSVAAAAAVAASADLYVELPVNLSVLRPRHTLSVADRLLAGARDLVANATVDCVPDGRPCAPGTGSCCEGLRCRGGVGGGGGGWRCLGPEDSEDEAGDRLRSLEAEGGGPLRDSHPWAYSWEFESRSDMEREDTMFAEEADWKRNWTAKEGKADDRWAKLREKIERKLKKVRENVEGKVKEVKEKVEEKVKEVKKNVEEKVKNAWQNMKMWKKVNELKGKIVEQYKQKISKKEEEKQQEVTEISDMKEPHVEEERAVTERSQKRLKTYSGDESHGFFVNNVGHIDEEGTSAEASEAKRDSEESVIKFSDEIPKRRKKNRRIDLRIDDIIKDGVDLIANKIGVKGKSKKGPGNDLSPGTSLEKQLYEKEDVDDTEDKLMKEINELKRLRKERDEREKNERKTDDLESDELIRKQVATILDEERKLEKLRKIEQLKRMEQGGNRVNKR